jgi:hypothetical protein
MRTAALSIVNRLRASNGPQSADFPPNITATLRNFIESVAEKFRFIALEVTGTMCHDVVMSNFVAPMMKLGISSATGKGESGPVVAAGAEAAVVTTQATAVVVPDEYTTTEPVRFLRCVRRMQPPDRLNECEPTPETTAIVRAFSVGASAISGSQWSAVMFAIWRFVDNPMTKKGNHRGYGPPSGPAEAVPSFLDFPPSLEPIVYHRILRCAAELGTFRVVIARGHTGLRWVRLVVASSAADRPVGPSVVVGKAAPSDATPVGSPQRSADGCRGSPK